MALTMRACVELHVYDGVASPTGVTLDVPGGKKHPRACTSMTDLVRKFQLHGDGHFYLAAGEWPDVNEVNLRKPYWPSMDAALDSDPRRRRRKADSKATGEEHEGGLHVR